VLRRVPPKPASDCSCGGCDGKPIQSHFRIPGVKQPVPACKRPISFCGKTADPLYSSKRRAAIRFGHVAHASSVIERRGKSIRVEGRQLCSSGCADRARPARISRLKPAAIDHGRPSLFQLGLMWIKLGSLPAAGVARAGGAKFRAPLKSSRVALAFLHGPKRKGRSGLQAARADAAESDQAYFALGTFTRCGKLEMRRIFPSSGREERENYLHRTCSASFSSPSTLCGVGGIAKIALQLTDLMRSYFWLENSPIAGRNRKSARML